MNASITLKLIVAMSHNGVIGHHNQLPWHLPQDLALFKRKTMGNAVLMGRKTFDSIIAMRGQPLPGRTHWVLTRQKNTMPYFDDAHFMDGIDAFWQAIAPQAQAYAQTHQLPMPIWLMGGAQLYAQCLPFCQELHISHVHTVVNGDAYFPPINWAEWQAIDVQTHTTDQQPFTAVAYHRIVSLARDRYLT